MHQTLHDAAPAAPPPAPAPAGPVRSADDGDVPNSVLGIGYDSAVLERQAEIEELAELAMAAEAGDTGAPDRDPGDIALPGEAEAEAVAAPTAPAAHPPAPGWSSKLLRTFAFAFAGAFLTAALPIVDDLASGTAVDFSVAGQLAVGAIAGALAAGVRAVVALAPIFPDDEVGLRARGRAAG